MGDLGKRIVVLQRDILDSQRALRPSSAYDCLTEIFHQVEIASYLLQEITVLVNISGDMVNSMDESNVNRSISREVQYGLNQLTNARKTVNLAAGYCSTSAISTTKAQEALSLFTEIENAFRLIGRRV